MQNLKVPVDLANAIANYLAQRPFAEVAQLISELQKCAVADDEKAKGVQTPIADLKK